MQSRKSDADVESICEICPSLTPAQILKLVKSYTTDDCEDAISQNFIENLSKRLKAVSEYHNYINEFLIKFRFYFSQQENQESFTMNENEIRPLCVSFKYDDMKLEDIDIPEVLKLNNLVTKI
jgi:myosin V